MNYYICEYVSEQKQTIKFEDNILKQLIKNSFPLLISSGNLCNKVIGFPYIPGKPALYLAGYEEFIAPHKLIPLYNTTGQLEGPSGYIDSGDNGQINTQLPVSRPRIGPTAFDQAYYYLTPFVYDNFIIDNNLDVRFKKNTQWLNYYAEYNGVSPNVIWAQTSSDTTRKHRPYDNSIKKESIFDSKFLLFPPTKTYTMFEFTPIKETNLYNVPEIGDVILNEPSNTQPWYDGKIKIMFEPGYIPPEIISSLGETIPLNSYLTLGTEMTNIDD